MDVLTRQYPSKIHRETVAENLSPLKGSAIFQIRQIHIHPYTYFHQNPAGETRLVH